MTPNEYIERLLAHAGVEADSVTTTEEEDTLRIEISVDEEEVGMLIGHHGETLAAMQRMVRIIFRDEDKRIVLDINDYRQRRQERLLEMAAETAAKVLETGEPYTFGYLPSNERFVIHSEISDNPEYAELESVSSGDGRQRRLTVQKKS